jgi:uncharacterized damage-inducible protein DinB
LALRAIIGAWDWKPDMTGPKQNELLSILQSHFPTVGDTIVHRLEKDPIFIEISENYQDCLNALQYWRRSNAPDTQARIREYQTISKELEQEALDTFGAQFSRPTS